MSGGFPTNLFSGLEHILSENVPLADYTWMRIGGPARFFLQPRTVDELRTVVLRCQENQVPMRIMGHGANLLIDDRGIDGAVIRLADEASGGQFSSLHVDGNVVTTGAATPLSRLVLRSVREGLSGMECLVGIPGSAGGAITMNAGGNFGDIGAIVDHITVMDHSGTVFNRDRAELVFAYRRTNIGNCVVLAGKFTLSEDDPQRVLRKVREIWILKKNNQPLSSRSAGCIFKNPPRQLSAGALIDRAGLKGHRIGSATVSSKHANFIVTEPDARFEDVQKLISLIRERVYDKFGIHLELEIEIWQ